MAEPLYIADVRWQCPSGHFIAEADISSEDHYDPDAYYGISAEIWGDCAVCGRVYNPRCIPIRWYEYVPDEGVAS